MVTVTDEILEESSQFIRFYPMSHCSLYFKGMRFLKLLYLLIFLLFKGVVLQNSPNFSYLFSVREHFTNTANN